MYKKSCKTLQRFLASVGGWGARSRGAGAVRCLGQVHCGTARRDNTLTFGKPTGEDDGLYTSTKYWHCYFCKGEKVRREFALINQ